MSDDLRDRIAALLRERVSCEGGSYESVADAVIVELGLRPDRVGTLTRWVTTWNEER